MPRTSAALVEEGRSARKRRLILEAATTLFLENGYAGTSMDQVAAQAAVSKQTVYKQFADKERLFTELILGITDRAAGLIEDMTATLDNSNDLEKDLTDFARLHINSVIQPQVLRLRRLIMSEAVHFPELARTYHERAPQKVIHALASRFKHLGERGLLHVEDPEIAARHFAWLILAAPLDEAMFAGNNRALPRAEVTRLATNGVRVFLAAYGSPRSS
jgi:TetR/AcrR family transcriptional regulator, mexJK operon transcriptional repressor